MTGGGSDRYASAPVFREDEGGDGGDDGAGLLSNSAREPSAAGGAAVDGGEGRPRVMSTSAVVDDVHLERANTHPLMDRGGGDAGLEGSSEDAADGLPVWDVLIHGGHGGHGAGGINNGDWS